MIKRILIFALTITLTCLAPVVVSASPLYLAGVMELAQEREIDVSYQNGYLLVTGAEGEALEVISLTGNKVLSTTIESPAQKIELNIPKGCYIVKVGKFVRKVSIR